MVRELSRVLNCRFEEQEPENEAGNEAPAHDKQNSPGTEPPGTEAAGIKSKRQPLPWLIAGIAIIATAVVLITVLIRPAEQTGKTGNPRAFISKTEEGVYYRIEDYNTVAPREEGKPYLTINTESRVVHGENRDLWMYDFILIEDQGKPVHLQQIIQVAFSADYATPQVFPEKDLASFQIGPVIGANQSSVFTGGCPLDQKDLLGIGLKVYAESEGGESMAFTAYIPFPAQ